MRFSQHWNYLYVNWHGFDVVTGYKWDPDRKYRQTQQTKSWYWSAIGDVRLRVNTRDRRKRHYCLLVTPAGGNRSTHEVFCVSRGRAFWLLIALAFLVYSGGRVRLDTSALFKR